MKIVQVAKTGLFISTIEVLGPLGYNLSVAAYWHKNYPYRSAVTGLTGEQLAESYEKAKGKQWNQQLGASLSLLDAGIAAVQASANPKDKAALAKALSTLQTTTMMGRIDFTKGPVPNVSPVPMIGAQWVKPASGSKFKYEYVITENVSDPSIPVGAKVKPYSL
jgi:branched-chain amino acid transport system substrate-binding protein